MCGRFLVCSLIGRRESQERWLLLEALVCGMTRLHFRIKYVKVWILFLVQLLNKPAFVFSAFLILNCRVSISVYLECEDGSKNKHVINVGCLWEKQRPFSYRNPR